MKGLDSSLPPFDVAWGPSAQLQGLPAEATGHRCPQALFYNVLKEVTVCDNR